MDVLINVCTKLWHLQSRISVAIAGEDILGNVVVRASHETLAFMIAPVIALCLALVVGALAYKYFFAVCTWVLNKTWGFARMLLLLCAVSTIAFVTFLLVLRLASPYGEKIATYIVQPDDAVARTSPSTALVVASEEGTACVWLPFIGCMT